MSASVSLYRKYRSQTFDELVGQEPVVKTLKSAIATGRIGHAYLFTGPRGVGKTSAARLLARAANCLSTRGDKPCNECANCLAAGREIATDLIEIDAASNTGVDNIREVIERAQFAPSIWHTKFYIIDEVHMLSVSAFNALLKTLEEPPPHVAFILATTEVHKVPATVASRCQRFDFRRVPLSAMVARLKWICEQEGIVADDAALELVARQATGSLRDAESLMDQLRVFAEGAISLGDVQDMLGASGSEQVADFVDNLIAADLASGLRLIGSIAEEGLDIRQFNRQIVEHLRSLMLVKSGAAQGESSLIDVTAEIRQRLTVQATKVTIPDLLRWIKSFAEADANLRTTAYRQLPLELALVEALTPFENAAATTAPRLQTTERAVEPVPRTGQSAPAREKPNGMAQRNDYSHGERTGAPLPIPIHAELGNAVVQPKVSNGNSQTDHDEVVAEVKPAETDGSGAAEAAPTGVLDATEFVDDGEQPADELARLKKLWPGLIDQINARSKNVAAVFRDPAQVRPYRVMGRNITVSFKYSIHAKRSQGEPARGIIEHALSRTLGYECVLEAITFDQESDDHDQGAHGNEPAPKGPQPKAPSPPETPLGRAAMNIFKIDKFDEQ